MLETIIRHLKGDKCGVSNVLVVMLSLVLVTVIVVNVVLWSYQMNQLDWEKTQEKPEITHAGNKSPWFTCNTYWKTQGIDNVCEFFEESSFGHGQTYYLPVTFVSAGTGSGTTGNPTPSYPTSLEADDLILLQVTVRDLTNVPAVPEDFTLLFGPDSSTTGTQWIYYKWSNGLESGTITVTIAGSSCKIARMYAFRNVDKNGLYEGESWTSGTTRIINAPSVAASRANSTAVAFVFVNDDNAVGSFVGETGGNWVEAVSEFTTTAGSDGCVQLQTATMSNPGAISGGSYTMSAADPWGVRAFVLKPKKILIQDLYSLHQSFLMDAFTFPVENIKSVEIQILYKASDSLERWFLKAYNWTAGGETYSSIGFNFTTGHWPSTEGFDFYAVSITSSVLKNYVSSEGALKIQLADEGPDENRTSLYIDFIGVRALLDGAFFIFKNSGASPLHIVSIWVIDVINNNHRRYDVDFFVNSGETLTCVMEDVYLSAGNFVVRVVTERGNMAIFVGD